MHARQFRDCIFVSIPFKRESVSELWHVMVKKFITLLVSIPFKRESVSEHAHSDFADNPSLVKVSIPFKRESVSEQVPKALGRSGIYGFQFPSNGKAYLNRTVQGRYRRDCWSGFNSLQTGKRIWTRSRWRFRNGSDLVSIPFKRESVSELSVRVVEPLLPSLRVSIPFKRESVSEPTFVRLTKEVVKVLKFQFPSNGKAYLNWFQCWFRLKWLFDFVSIPFKRESVSEHMTLLSGWWSHCVSIPFKRESVSEH